jgi:hypothetical protein
MPRDWTGLDAQVPEQGGHVGSEVFVVLVDGGQPGRDVVVPADLDAGQDRGDDVVPEGKQGRYGPGGRAGQVVAAGPAGFADELLAAAFAQVVGSLAGVVGGVGLPGHGVDLGSHIGPVQLAAEDGATVLAPADGHREFPRTALADGDETDLGGLTLRALPTPGHTGEHLSYLLLDGSRELEVFTGGSLIVGSADARAGSFCSAPPGTARVTTIGAE